MGSLRVARLALALGVATLLCGCAPDSDGSYEDALGDDDLARSAVAILDRVHDPDVGHHRDVLSTSLRDPQVEATLDEVAVSGPWDVETSERDGPTLDVVLRSRAGQMMLMHLEHGPDALVDVLWFGPAIDRSVVDGTAAGVRSVVQALPVTIAAVRAEGDSIDTEGPSDRPLPMASVAKVIVVAAAIDAVDGGSLRWDDLVTIEPTDVALPSTPASPPAGEERSIDDLTWAALAEGDNTAADVLLRTLGVDEVESVWREITGSAWTGPFLSTKQVLEAGWGDGAMPVGVDLDGDEPSHELEKIAARAPRVEPTQAVAPRWSDGIDWLAPAADVAAVGQWVGSSIDRLGPKTRRLFDDPLTKTGGTPGVVSSMTIDVNGAVPVVTVVQIASTRTSDVGDDTGLLLLADRLLETAS